MPLQRVTLAPDVVFRLAGPTYDLIEIACGKGQNRVALDCNQEALVAWLLSLRYGTARLKAISSAKRTLGISRDSADQLITALLLENVLVEIGPGQRQRPRSPSEDRWIELGWRDALDFHKATTDLQFESGDDAGMARQIASLRAMAAQPEHIPSAEPYKSYNDVATLPLPRSEKLLNKQAFGHVLANRRTRRNFQGRQISLEQFSEVLEHSFGQTGCIDSPATGRHILRTSPSGGARHPVEVYPVVFRVEGVAPGLYHYSVRHHALEQLKLGDFQHLVWEYGHQQSGLRHVSVAFFFTVRWFRHMWKYRYARSYRMVMFDVAHLVQTQQLVATAVGLGTFLTPAVSDSAAEQFIGLDDPLDESILYISSIG